MKRVGEKVELLSVRPGERIYGGPHEITERSPKRMMLRSTHDPMQTVEIRVLERGDLHDDQLSGPPEVLAIYEIHEPALESPSNQKNQCREYFYEIGDVILLIQT